MKLDVGLWQHQTLKLQMTQELSQAIALLQYSSQELVSFLEEKAMENPLLKVESKYDQVIETRKQRSKVKSQSTQRNGNWIESIGTESKSLEEHLYSQINSRSLSFEQKKVLDELILNIDENGYLCRDIRELALELETSEVLLRSELERIQELEPAGIGARTLAECLYLQMKRLGQHNDLVEQLLLENFNEFAGKKWRELSKKLNTSPVEIQQVFDAIQKLNPRPASSFTKEQPIYITPDIVIEREGEEFLIRIFDEVLPKISFNEPYYEHFSTFTDSQVNRFLQEKQQDYYWIVKALEQRKETLTKVAITIVEKQQEYFKYGSTHIKPMTMKELADEIGIHESTVSRAVREKYAQTPFGLVELRSFFSSALSTTCNENTSSKKVKEMIHLFIEQENKEKPLSDQDIVLRLEEEENIVVSRRTIAKYREQLGIQSSTKRKRYK